MPFLESAVLQSNNELQIKIKKILVWAFQVYEMSREITQVKGDYGREQEKLRRRQKI